MRQGQRITRVPTGKVIGNRKINNVIDTCNAFLNMQPKPKGKLLVSEHNSILDLTDDPASSSNSTSGAFFHPFKVYHVDGQPFNMFQVRGGVFEHRTIFTVMTYASGSDLWGSLTERPRWVTDGQGADGIATDSNGWNFFDTSQAATSPEVVTVSNSGVHTVSADNNFGQFVIDTTPDGEGRVNCAVWLEITDNGTDFYWRINFRMWSNGGGAGTTGRTDSQTFPGGPLVIPLAVITNRDINSPPTDATDLIVYQIATTHVIDRYPPTYPVLNGLNFGALPTRFRGVWTEDDEWGLLNRVAYPGDIVVIDVPDDTKTTTSGGFGLPGYWQPLVATQTSLMTGAPVFGSGWWPIGGFV